MCFRIWGLFWVELRVKAHRRWVPALPEPRHPAVPRLSRLFPAPSAVRSHRCRSATCRGATLHSPGTKEGENRRKTPNCEYASVREGGRDRTDRKKCDDSGRFAVGNKRKIVSIKGGEKCAAGERVGRANKESNTALEEAAKASTSPLRVALLLIPTGTIPTKIPF